MAINPTIYSYSRNSFGVLVRHPDNALVPENDPNNGAYILYQQWIAAGNEPIPGGHQDNFPHTPPRDDETVPPEPVEPAPHRHKHD